MTMLNTIGWIATAVFSTSYFFKSSTALRWIQAGAALLWVTYGVLIHAMPVVVANVIVASAAVYSSLAAKKTRERPQYVDNDSLQDSIS